MKINIKYIALLIIIVCFTVCDTTESNEEQLAYVEISVIADGFGNHDNSAADDEITAIIDYFNTNTEAWSVGAISEPYWDTLVNKIPNEEVVNLIRLAPLRGPFTNKDAFEEMSLRISWLGIYCIKSQNDKYYIEQFFRAPGPHVGQDEYWMELKIY